MACSHQLWHRPDACTAAQVVQSTEDLPERDEKVFIADSMPQQSVMLRGPASKMAFVSRDREVLGFPRREVCTAACIRQEALLLWS